MSRAASRPASADAMIVMGRIGAPHGVRGEVRVRPLASDPAVLLEPKQWWIRRLASNDAWQPCILRGARMQGSQVVVQVDDAATRDAAAVLRGAEIGVERSELPPLDAGEWYRHDLIGMTVVAREEVVLGRVGGFRDSGAHPLLEVSDEYGACHLIPWVPAYVLAVDVERQRIEVDWQPDY